MEDTSNENLLPIIPKCKSFIDQCLSAGGICLVHSYLAVSRSPVVVAAYVMETKSLSYIEAMELVKRRRYCIYPNEHFLRQLKEYEAIYRAQQTIQLGHCSQARGQRKRKFDEAYGGGSNEEEDEPMDQMS